MRVLFSLAAVLALIGCSGASYSGVTDNNGNQQPVLTTNVSIRNLAFSPRAIQVSPGATVDFTNNDGTPHNIIFSSAAINGATDFSAGSRAIVMPVAPGTYAYHCTIHPGMTGSVLVQ
ncbi:MAG TPA: plastocyanin/azurin family copper-binding protein [Gemmatimonadaceae bacterium]|nr:plastocyanin/azurin family copper-binding protein [Gemmatimonadaceae bacterium]